MALKVLSNAGTCGEFLRRIYSSLFNDTEDYVVVVNKKKNFIFVVTKVYSLHTIYLDGTFFMRLKHVNKALMKEKLELGVGFNI